MYNSNRCYQLVCSFQILQGKINREDESLPCELLENYVDQSQLPVLGKWLKTRTHCSHPSHNVQPNTGLSCECVIPVTTNR